MKEEKDKPVDSEPAFENPSSDESATGAEQLITHNSELITKNPTDEKTSSSKPIAKTEPPSTQTLQPSTPKDMEVHHHAHSDRKKWSHYFWEFLMLFLAVFCGFLAEYQLEHKIERDREKQFIISLTSDLQDDIKTLDVRIADEKRGIAKLDTLVSLLNNPQLAKQNGDQLYYVSRVGPRSEPFANNSRTFDQLRNSGGFRLIRNAEVSNNIMGYYSHFSLIRLMEDNYNHEFDNYKRVAAKILDPGILRRQEADNGEILRSNDNPALRTYDADLLKELSYHTLQMNGSRRSNLLLLENLKKTAEELIFSIQDKYHL